MTISKMRNKTKGHRSERVKFHIPYYTKEFFNPKGLEDGEDSPDSEVTRTVKIPVKINTEGDDSRSNITNWEMKGISHFEGNVENVLNSFYQLHERIIMPKQIVDPNEEIKETLHFMKLICNRGTATQTLQEAGRAARQKIYDDHVQDLNIMENEIDEDAFVKKPFL